MDLFYDTAIMIIILFFFFLIFLIFILYIFMIIIFMCKLHEKPIVINFYAKTTVVFAACTRVQVPTLGA